MRPSFNFLTDVLRCCFNISTIFLPHEAIYFVKCTSPSCSKAHPQHYAATPCFTVGMVFFGLQAFDSSLGERTQEMCGVVEKQVLMTPTQVYVNFRLQLYIDKYTNYRSKVCGQKQLFSETHQSILVLKIEGYSMREMAKKLKICFLHRTAQTGSNQNRLRSGWPRGTTEQQDKYVRVSSFKNRRLTSPQLAASLNCTCKIDEFQN